MPTYIDARITFPGSTESLLVELCGLMDTLLSAKNVSKETFAYLLLHYYPMEERQDIDFELCQRVLKMIEEDRRNV